MYAASPLRHWSEQNMRKFFEKYAWSVGADPLLAQTWYNIPSETIRQIKVFFFFFFCLYNCYEILIYELTQGVIAIMGKFKGGYFHALQHLFPEITFDRSVLHGCTIFFFVVVRVFVVGEKVANNVN